MDPAANSVDKAAHPADLKANEKIRLSDAEAALLASLRAGEDCGYEVLVRTYGPRVMAVARRYFRCKADIADCFQDTFLTVFQNIDSFQQRSSLGYWIRGIAIKQCLMKLRQQQRRREQSIDDLLPMFDEKGNRIASNPHRASEQSEILDARSVKRIVRDSIDSLPYGHRAVLLLRDIDGYTTKETGAILGIKENAVKTRLHRARSALKALLEPVLERTI